MSGGAPHRRPRGPLRVLPPYHRPTLLTEFRVTSSERGFNRMKLIETPQTTLLRTKNEHPPEEGHPPARSQMAGRPAFRPASCTSPPPQET